MLNLYEAAANNSMSHVAFSVPKFHGGIFFILKYCNLRLFAILLFSLIVVTVAPDAVHDHSRH